MDELQPEIEEYAEFLGMDLEKDRELFWIAREGLKAPLPAEWKPCQTESGDVYYFNFETKESIWDHPCDDYYRNMYKAEKEKLAAKSEASTPDAGVGATRQQTPEGGRSRRGSQHSEPSRPGTMSSSSSAKSISSILHSRASSKSGIKALDPIPTTSRPPSRHGGDLHKSLSSSSLHSHSGSVPKGHFKVEPILLKSRIADDDHHDAPPLLPASAVHSRQASAQMSRATSAHSLPVLSMHSSRAPSVHAVSVHSSRAPSIRSSHSGLIRGGETGAARSRRGSAATMSRSSSHGQLEPVMETPGGVHDDSGIRGFSAPSLPSMGSAALERRRSADSDGHGLGGGLVTSALTARVAELESLLESKDHDIVELEAAIERLRAQAKIQEDIIADRRIRHDREIQDLREQLDKERKQHAAKVADLDQQLRDQAAQVDDLVQGHDAHENVMKDARAAHQVELAQVRQDVERKYCSQLDELKSRVEALADCERETNALKSENGHLKDLLASQEQELHNVARVIEEWRTRATAAEKQLHEIQSSRLTDRSAVALAKPDQSLAQVQTDPAPTVSAVDLAVQVPSNHPSSADSESCLSESMAVDSMADLDEPNRDRIADTRTSTSSVTSTIDTAESESSATSSPQLLSVTPGIGRRKHSRHTQDEPILLKSTHQGVPEPTLPASSRRRPRDDARPAGAARSQSTRAHLALPPLEVNDELHEVERNLHMLLQKIHTRRTQFNAWAETGSFDLPVAASPSGAPASSSSPLHGAGNWVPSTHVATGHPLDSVERTCYLTERKIREHTTWLNNLMSTIEDA
ncbi:hypothetical protein AMAG_00601 [Allomyces macrogynus ATCC 38327]|uniref:WW domain-containing protein n=1 Tax=Allomyces macrogynus (strain ATCC 38327) TaxID=578462 RepID=A0A0L0RWY3_ALLM3|nr:hypothetical protein AMAG_00601 [Allomyces macrogynus ATCC 38327]|eukprot:KNE54640.1 hypothetical protein AMAG_00601 [Allomyces macrogynus ATCC 38327]